MVNTRTHSSTFRARMRRGWKFVHDGFGLAVLLVFLTMTVYPANALALVNDVELSHLTLVFERDPSLEGRAIVGVEALPSNHYVVDVLVSDSVTVRSSLAEGSAVRVLATAYSSTGAETDDSPNITASGRRAGPGVIAANFLPFGTQVRIGNQLYTVWDRMNSRFDDKYVIDIWQPSRAEALEHGARVLELEIIDLPDH